MAERKFYKEKPGPGYVLEQGHGWYLPDGVDVGQPELMTPEKKAKEAAEKAKLQGAPMPLQKDFGTFDEFREAMRKWRLENRTAKDAAGALANRPKK